MNAAYNASWCSWLVSEHMLDPSLGPSLTPQDWPQLREQLGKLFQHFEVRGAS